MKITLNGALIEIAEGDSLREAVLSLGRGTTGLAAAVNGELVPASRWASHPLSPGDRVEVLGAAQGG